MAEIFAQLLYLYDGLIKAPTSEKVLHNQLWVERAIFVAWGRAVGLSADARSKPLAGDFDDGDLLRAVEITMKSVVEVCADRTMAWRNFGVRKGGRGFLRKFLWKTTEEEEEAWQIADGRKFKDLVDEMKRVNCDLERIVSRNCVPAHPAEREFEDEDEEEEEEVLEEDAMAGIPPPAYYHPVSAPPSPPASNSPSPSPSPLPSNRHKPRRSRDLPPALAALLTTYNMTVQTYGPSAPEALSIEDLLWHNHFSQAPDFSAAHTAQITHGRDSPETIRALHSLARNLSDKQDFATALALYTICLSRETRVYGNSHPQTLRSMSGLAFAFQNVGKDEDALEMYQRALSRWGDVVNVYTVRARVNVASIYADNGRFEDAEEVLRRTVQEAGVKLGGGHESTKLAMHNLGFLLRALGRGREAAGTVRCSEGNALYAGGAMKRGGFDSLFVCFEIYFDNQRFLY
ncbi:unnamed protein product [Tuber melanosporum]|uniref:(Perigord truffle) hypothetical protein n=1 Tax=Tuber melanosporum (strain Mel28) TaxID=656061 RepID=D5GAE9_TUBMM|nr:uncharacterized protein GSTUM_00005254001 [Tuber melanosporum]CAZ81492.1 unnamed protein product [Tuber melanosporum]